MVGFGNANSAGGENKEQFIANNNIEAPTHNNFTGSGTAISYSDRITSSGNGYGFVLGYGNVKYDQNAIAQSVFGNTVMFDSTDKTKTTFNGSGNNGGGTASGFGYGVLIGTNNVEGYNGNTDIGATYDNDVTIYDSIINATADTAVTNFNNSNQLKDSNAYGFAFTNGTTTSFQSKTDRNNSILLSGNDFNIILNGINSVNTGWGIWINPKNVSGFDIRGRHANTFTKKGANIQGGKELDGNQVINW